MKLALVLKPEQLTCTYGTVPNVPNATDANAEVFHFELEEGIPFSEFYERFVSPLNSVCGTLLDNGDVDYIDADRCTPLIEWIQEKFAANTDQQLQQLLEQLLNYAQRAVKLGTGVVVEL